MSSPPHFSVVHRGIDDAKLTTSSSFTSSSPNINYLQLRFPDLKPTAKQDRICLESRQELLHIYATATEHLSHTVESITRRSNPEKKSLTLSLPSALNRIQSTTNRLRAILPSVVRTTVSAPAPLPNGMISYTSHHTYSLLRSASSSPSNHHVRKFPWSPSFHTFSKESGFRHDVDTPPPTSLY